jgi:hypothetical protein
MFNTPFCCGIIKESICKSGVGTVIFELMKVGEALRIDIGSKLKTRLFGLLLHAIK